ncbi:DM7 family protein GD24576 [Drosophila simulans]|uniref:DM7 family protein GD24576 n=1 Tax=Drosophila simulans TaxID=7240 RepID=UPI00078AE175|nr:DM7 family protein GD24576 [Drosophila simulans]KMZ08694.1 uncharacterized protein Dsimw501_GD24576 [Drosophila simulans]
MLRMDTVHRDKDQVVILKKTNYLPYLVNLFIPKLFYPEKIVVARLYLNVNKHDKHAAENFKGTETPCFDVPPSLFSDKVPMDKIVFLPTVMLPMGFEAGGVFGPGVLTRRSYPIDLKAAGHKGQTPPLFIGLLMDIQAPTKVESLLKEVGESQPAQDILMNWVRASNNLINGEQPKEQELRDEFSLSMVFNLPTPPSPPSPYPYGRIPLQFNIYTPDLSNVLLLMSHQRDLTVAILSTINNPHVPSVAFAAMGDEEECPKFELPLSAFPTFEGVNRPIFLPKRFMPKGFEAGCVLKPGALSDLWFMDHIGRFGPTQPQHNGSITPPLFVGKICREEPTVDMIRKIQLEIEKKASEDATLPAVKPKIDISITKGFMVMETAAEDPKPPKGAYSVQSYEEAFDDGCVVKVAKRVATEATDTRGRDEIRTSCDQSQEKDEGSAEADKKHLSCFHVDSDIDNIAMAMARMGVADMSLPAEGEAMPGIDGDRALIQLSHVIEDRNQIRTHTDQLMQDHIFRMNRNRMLALRQPFTCIGCGAQENK